MTTRALNEFMRGWRVRRGRTGWEIQRPCPCMGFMHASYYCPASYRWFTLEGWRGSPTLKPKTASQQAEAFLHNQAPRTPMSSTHRWLQLDNTFHAWNEEGNSLCGLDGGRLTLHEAPPYPHDGYQHAMNSCYTCTEQMFAVRDGASVP